MLSPRHFPLEDGGSRVFRNNGKIYQCTRRHVPGTVSEVTSSNLTTLNTADILKISNIQILKHLTINSKYKGCTEGFLFFKLL